MNRMIHHSHHISKLRLDQQKRAQMKKFSRFVFFTFCWLALFDGHVMTKNRVTSLLSLQQASNGFDMRGVTDPAYLKDGPYLTNDAAFWIGFGFTKSLLSKSDVSPRLKIGLGKDSRQSGEELLCWLASGIEKAGGSAYNVGLSTTPAMYSCCTNETILNHDINDRSSAWPFDGTIMITASHLPSHWNGFKLFTKDHPSNIGAEGIGALIEAIESSDYDDITPSLPASGPIICDPYLPVYSRILQNTVKSLTQDYDQPLKGFNIIVNAGNGAGGFLAQTLAELGANTSQSLHLEPDGSFPNHIANPEDKIAITTTANKVISTNADLGICLDTDADRVGLVDKGGKLLNRNGLVALVSRVALRNDEGSYVVTDSSTSNGLARFILGPLKGKHLRYKKGYRYVIEKARTLKDCVVAVECSGHSAWKDNNWVDDGCYTAVRLLAELYLLRKENPLACMADLVRDLEEPCESIELRFKVKEGKHKTEGVTDRAVKILNDLAIKTEQWNMEPVNYEGLRVNFNIRHGDEMLASGWCMLRKSLHEPIVSLQMESEQHNGCKIALQSLLAGRSYPVHGSHSSEGFQCLEDELDLSPLLQFLADEVSP